jgi:hypothetical protein
VLAKPAFTVPSDGEAMIRYEVAGWVVARELQWTHLVATTVLKTTDAITGSDEEASVQVLWPEFDPSADISNFPDEEIWQAAVFDVLVLHSDRGHNWGGVPGDGGMRLKLVDHGYAFRDWPGRPFQSTFETQKRGQALPDELMERLSQFIPNANTSELADLLEPDVLQALTERGEHLLGTGVLTQP